MTNAQAAEVFGSAVPVPGDLRWHTGIEGRRTDAHQRARILRDAARRPQVTLEGTRADDVTPVVLYGRAANRQEAIGNGETR